MSKAVQVANDMAALLGLSTSVTPDDVRHYDDYGGPGYGIPTEEGLAAMRLDGRTEGLIADPVYTGKALAGLLDHLRAGQFAPDATVVFVHTGGQPLIFNYAAEICREPDRS